MSTINFQTKPLISNCAFICMIRYDLLHSYPLRRIIRLSTQMEKVDFSQQFACRLRDAMIAAGFNSQRSTSGVCIHKLAEITGHSLQICRKYLKGGAIPDPVKLMDIADNLQVSPGWLLFGDTHHDSIGSKNRITISKNVLHYIFMQALPLCDRTHLDTEIPEFLMGLIQDVSLINADEKQSKKIIDLALSSLQNFSGK
jgi:hypothetical protein